MNFPTPPTVVGPNMSTASKVVQRYLQASSEPFEGTFDLDRYLWDSGPRSGWRQVKDKSGHFNIYAKRFSGIWYQILMSKGSLSNRVYLSPSKMPPGLDLSDREKWDQVKDAVSVWFDVKGHRIEDIERKIEELVREYKKYVTVKRTDPNKLHYRGLEGKEALAAWKREVEAKLQDIIDNGASRGQDYTTQDLTGNLLENYRLELGGVDRPFMARAIRATLEAMAKAGKIEKDTNERNPRWFGKNWVSKSRW